MKGKYKFRIGSGDLDPSTGVYNAYNRNAETEHEHKGTFSYIALEMLAPLFDNRISVAERMLIHFKLGVTLVHELCVSEFLYFEAELHLLGV